MVKCIKGKQTYYGVQLTVGKFYDFEIRNDIAYTLITDYNKYFELTSIIASNRDNPGKGREIYELRKHLTKRITLPTLVIIGDDGSKHHFCNVKHEDIIKEHNIIIDIDPINEKNGHQSRIFDTSVYMTETYLETMDVLRNRALEKLGI